MQGLRHKYEYIGPDLSDRPRCINAADDNNMLSSLCYPVLLLLHTVVINALGVT